MSVASEDLRQLWQRQALDAPRLNLTYLRHQLQRLQWRTQVRNGLEYVGVLVAIVWMLVASWGFIRPRPITSFGLALWALAIVYIAWQRHRRTAVSLPAEQLGTLDALQLYRQELERQRDARRGRWWLPPIIPGMVVLPVGLALESSKTWIVIGALVAWFILGVTMALVRNEREARGIQDEIDALESMSKQGS
jgi:hypothetical protein